MNFQESFRRRIQDGTAQEAIWALNDLVVIKL